MGFSRGQGRHAKQTHMRPVGVGAVVVLGGACLITIIGVTITVTIGAQPATQAQPAAAPTRLDPNASPQTRALLGELYKEGVSSDKLSPESALIAADGVCKHRAEGKTLVALTGDVQDLLRQLTPLQRHRFVDLSVRYYCGR